MERNSEKRQRAKYPAGQAVLHQLSKFRDNEPDNVDGSIDNCWKYHRVDEIDGIDNIHGRRQSNSAIVHKNHRYPTDVPKKSRNKYGSSWRPKQVIAPTTRDECSLVCNKNEGVPRLSRTEPWSGYLNNYANYARNVGLLVRKNRYDDYDGAYDENLMLEEFGNEAKETYAEVGPEGNHDNVTEFSEKEYEEQEADDEIEEESDPVENPTDRAKFHRKFIADPRTTRDQKISRAPVAPRCHHAVKIDTRKTMDRCCHSAGPRKKKEILNYEEDEEELEISKGESYSPSKTTWKYKCDNGTWNPPERRSFERSSSFTETSQSLQTRRKSRTMRPEMLERNMRFEPQRESSSHIRCDRCGRTSGPPPKTTSSRNATYRLQDTRYFIADHNSGKTFDDPTTMAWQSKTKPSTKQSRPPMYESTEREPRIEDEVGNNAIGANYKSHQGKNLRDKSKLGRSSIRNDDRYEEKFISSSNKRC